MKRIALSLILALLPIASFAQASLPAAPKPQPVPAQTTTTQLQELYGAGVAFAPGTNQLYAATAYEAHLLTGQTYTFTDFILVPTKVTNPDGTKSTVYSKNIGVGAAVRLFEIAGRGVYTTGTGGPSWTGSDTTWQFNYGLTFPYPIKKGSHYMILPIVTGVSSGNGTTFMYEATIAWGK